MNDLFKDAMDLWEEATDASNEQRRQIEEDKRFSNPSDPQQWVESTMKARMKEAMPVEVYDQTNQYVMQVQNDAAMNKPQILTLPSSSGADQKVSEALNGLIRATEYASRADIAYDVSIADAARTGLGWMRVIPVVVDEQMNYQEPRICAVMDNLSIRTSFYEQPDGSDMTYGFVETSIPKTLYQQKYGKKIPSNWDKGQYGDWFKDDTVRICEMFRKVETKKSMIAVKGDDGEYASEEEDDYWATNKKVGFKRDVGRTFTKSTWTIEWLKMSGDDFIDDKTTFPSKYIPLIPTHGYEMWIDGKRTLSGMVRRMMPGQRAYNIERNANLMLLSQQPKVPYLVADESVEDFQDDWKSANVSNKAYLRYKAYGENGEPLPPPQRVAPPSFSPSYAQAGQMAVSDLQASIGMYKANLGAPSNETSGIAIRRREEQGDTANFHYQNSQVRALTQVGKILIDMYPRLIDTKRMVQIMSIDGSTDSVEIDPGMKAPVEMSKAQNGQPGKKVAKINLSTGDYDVRVKVGPAYASLREEAAGGMEQIIRAFPAFAPVLGPMWARMQDWPESDKAAKLMLALAPPEVQQLESSDEEIPPGALMQIQQLKQQLQQVQGQAQAFSKALESAAQEHQAAEQKLANRMDEGKHKQQANEVDLYRAQTDRITALAAGLTPVEYQALLLQVMESALQQQPLDNTVPLPSMTPQQMPPQGPAMPQQPVPQPMPQQ